MLIGIGASKMKVYGLARLQMAELFPRDRTVVSRYISSVFEEMELNEKEVCANFAHTTQYGVIKWKP